MQRSYPYSSPYPYPSPCAEELLTDYRTVCSELYALTVRPGAAAADERRAMVADELRSAEATVAQLRRELDRLSDE